jgi:hypothetical protein
MTALAAAGTISGCIAGATVPYPNDRRRNGQLDEETLSPEYLAVLVACGGEVRAEDRAAKPEIAVERRRRRRADDAVVEAADSPTGAGSSG